MHISENEILLYLEGKLSETEKSGYEKHFGRCSECTAKLTEIYSFNEEIKKTENPEVPDTYFEKARLFGLNRTGDISINKAAAPSLAFALSVLLVSAVAVLFYLSTRQPGNVQTQYRGEKAIGYSMKLFPADGSVLASDHLNFSWSKISNAIEYKMTIYDLKGNMIFKRSVQDTILNFKSGNHIIPGNTYLWNIKVFLPDGRAIKSGIHSFKYSQK